MIFKDEDEDADIANRQPLTDVGTNNAFTLSLELADTQRYHNIIGRFMTINTHINVISYFSVSFGSLHHSPRGPHA